MKNILTLTLAILLLFGFSGCKENPTDYGKNSSPQVTSNEITTQEDLKTNEFISKDKAKQIALSKAGVTSNKVKNFDIELDFDDDTKLWEYSVEFNVGRTEYDCEIIAKTGKIIEFKVDKD